MTSEKPALILIVDDDYDFLELNRMILEKAGYRVVTAAEPQQALVKMAREKPDLVISDLMMTTLDSGFSFARVIKEHPDYDDIPVVIATSVTSALGLDFRPRSQADMVEMRIDAYFDKPLDPARLLSRLAELLEAKAGGSSAREATEGD
ncbi:MAG: response regulator [Actinobacteria bacterium]|nr:response regulator [Actinomycetota bacterium]